MRKRLPPGGFSNDPKYAPHYTNKTYHVYWSHLKQKIFAIQDDDRTHYPFLKQWVGMEIDINDQWSINNGTLAYDVYLHNAGKHEMHFLVRLKIEDAELILKTPNHVIGIITDNMKLIFAFVPLGPEKIQEFLEFKKDVDKFVKKKHLSPKAWSVQ